MRTTPKGPRSFSSTEEAWVTDVASNRTPPKAERREQKRAFTMVQLIRYEFLVSSCEALNSGLVSFHFSETDTANVTRTGRENANKTDSHYRFALAAQIPLRIGW